MCSFSIYYMLICLIPIAEDYPGLGFGRVRLPCFVVPYVNASFQVVRLTFTITLPFLLFNNKGIQVLVALHIVQDRRKDHLILDVATLRPIIQLIIQGLRFRVAAYCDLLFPKKFPFIACSHKFYIKSYAGEEVLLFILIALAPVLLYNTCYYLTHNLYSMRRSLHVC